MLADIIVDLQYGDCGKGKITHHLCRHGDYTHVLRYNGGCNAGHTIYHEGKKFVTHHIPAGVFFGVKSIIGSGCVVNPVQFFAEIDELEAAGIKTQGLVFIADNAHVITADHLAEDGTDTTIGTTKQGNGPAYREGTFRLSNLTLSTYTTSSTTPPRRLVSFVKARKASGWILITEITRLSRQAIALAQEPCLTLFRLLGLETYGE
jgi:adenylosuccinate synthase